MEAVYHPLYLEHKAGREHPESPQRLASIVEGLSLKGMNDFVVPESAPEERVLKVHDEKYLQYLEAVRGNLDQDTYLTPRSFEIALLAAGGGLEAGRLAREGKDALALLRPPGHHAGKAFGGGFCLLNNIAISAGEFRENGEKVAILDLDGHHGNGTQDIFYEDSGTLYMSTHHWGIFPGTGRIEESGTNGNIVNLPMMEGSGDRSYMEAMDRLWHPILRQFNPDVVLISLGVDCHYMDPLTALALSSPGLMKILRDLMELAHELTGRGVAIMLEGGYNLDVLREIFVELALGEGELRFNKVLDEDGVSLNSLERAISYQSRFWDL